MRCARTEESEKEEFWLSYEDLKKALNNTKNNENITIQGKFNAKVEKEPDERIEGDFSVVLQVLAIFTYEYSVSTDTEKNEITMILSDFNAKVGKGNVEEWGSEASRTCNGRHLALGKPKNGPNRFW